MKKTFGKMLSYLFKKSPKGKKGKNSSTLMDKVKGALGITVVGAGAVAVAEGLTNPKDGWVVNKLADFYTALTNATKEAGVDSGFQGVYKFFEKLATFIESFTGKGSMSGMRDWAKRGMGEDLTEGEALFNASSGQVIDADGNTIANHGGPDISNTEEWEVKDSFNIAAVGTGAAIALKTGLRVIPVVATASALIEGAWDTGAYALKGQWKEAGIRAASTLPEMAGGVFGGLSYPFGIAGREKLENHLNEKYDANVEDGFIASKAKDLTKYVFGT